MFSLTQNLNNIVEVYHLNRIQFYKIKIMMSLQKKDGDIQNVTMIPLSSPCKKVVAGYNHSYAISSTQIYHWGEAIPLLSQPPSISDPNASEFKSVVPEITTIPISVSDISTGKHHGFGWNEKEVYCWGSNIAYELGLQKEKEYGLTKMVLLQKAIEKEYKLGQISCGEHHTLAVFHVQTSVKGKEFDPEEHLEQDHEEQVFEKAEDYDDSSNIQLFAWGASESHQLTLNTLHIVPYPVLAPLSFRSLEKISSNSDFNVALCNGKVYSWGCNLFSRLGLPALSSQLPKVRLPRLVSLPEKIVKIAMGTYHVVVVSSSGSAYAWGKGNLGQLGIDRYQAETKPVKINCPQLISDASCGQSHTLVLLSDGRLKSCGSNLHGALGHESYNMKDKKKRAKVLEFVNWDKQDEIIGISCGKNHNLVVTRSGSVYGWGSNEFGQVLPHRFKFQFLEQKGISLQDPNKMELFEPQPSLQSIIDTQTTKHSTPSHLQELQSWRHRYTLFLSEKQRQERELLLQFDSIMQKMRERQQF